MVEPEPAVERKRKLTSAFILVLALSLCVAFVLLTWPGSSSHGKFYAYPVTGPLAAFWLAGCSVVLVPTFLILWIRRKK